MVSGHSHQQESYEEMSRKSERCASMPLQTPDTDLRRKKNDDVRKRVGGACSYFGRHCVDAVPGSYQTIPCFGDGVSTEDEEKSADRVGHEVRPDQDM